MAGLSSAVVPWGTAIVLALMVSGCAGDEGEPTSEQGVSTLSIEVTSSAFTEGARIPTKHTCEGQDISPALKFSGVPQGAKSIALISDDPDAPGGTWVHWVLYGLPPDTAALAEGVPRTDVLSNGARQGNNDFPRIGYGGARPRAMAPITITSRYTRWTTRSTSRPAPLRKTLKAPWRATYWPRAS